MEISKLITYILADIFVWSFGDQQVIDSITTLNDQTVDR